LHPAVLVHPPSVPTGQAAAEVPFGVATLANACLAPNPSDTATTAPYAAVQALLRIIRISGLHGQ
jgi:hypothetical protein